MVAISMQHPINVSGSSALTTPILADLAAGMDCVVAH
jgi:hypothetical protein